MPKTRLSATLYLILVFASGILVGIVSHRLYVTTTVNANYTLTPPPRTAEQVRKQYLADMRVKVGVNDQQLDAVNRILDNTKQRFDDLQAKDKVIRDQIHQEQIDQIDALLTPAERTAYANWRAERARLHELQRKQQAQAANKK
jgi:hypothetical protein